MPKVIDKYVLEDKIGKGQFGEVFRGRHQDTMQVVAVKTIKRDMIKGKFYQLLENEIKVLKTCDNPHIIKLMALKKTPHNYYLMLQYCDGGDMLQKVRQKGKLPQEMVLRYFCQILNAFQTLVNHKIMHRDFKLANILLHRDDIKIADFGFAKLLQSEDYTSTMLGSPLNMAPEVLANSQYNSKADIWSIGACVYQMLYGKPPFVASNMVDLLKLIKSKPLTLPSEPKIYPQLADALKQMLTPDVKRRIQWHNLFKHPVARLLHKKKVNEVQLQLAQDQSLMMNTSKCYLKNNLVVQNVSINEFLTDIIKNGKKGVPKELNEDLGMVETDEVNRLNQHNSKILLHYRNIYAFLASVADTIINRNQDQHHQIATFVIVRKILATIQWLLHSTSSTSCKIKGVKDWNKYAKTAQLQEIRNYVSKELEVFSVFNQSLEPIVKKHVLEGVYGADVTELISGPLKQITYIKYLRSFLKKLAQSASSRALVESNLLGGRVDWKLLYYGLKISFPEQTFGESDGNFDFKAFYGRFQTSEQEAILLQIEKLLTKMEKSV